MPVLNSELFRSQELLGRRMKQRQQGRRLVFDCFEAKVCSTGDRVKCTAGHSLGVAKDGGIPLVTVLKGRPCPSDCPDYDDDGTFGD